MPRKVSQSERMKQVWNLLVRERGTLTYQELSIKLRAPDYRPIPQAMGKLLAPIKDYCRAHRLPMLNDLVVNKSTQRPSYTPDTYDFEDSLRKILAYDWSRVSVTERDFR